MNLSASNSILDLLGQVLSRQTTLAAHGHARLVPKRKSLGIVVIRPTLEWERKPSRMIEIARSKEPIISTLAEAKPRQPWVLQECEARNTASRTGEWYQLAAFPIWAHSESACLAKCAGSVIGVDLSYNAGRCPTSFDDNIVSRSDNWAGWLQYLFSQSSGSSLAEDRMVQFGIHSTQDTHLDAVAKFVFRFRQLVKDLPNSSGTAVICIGSGPIPLC